MLLCAEVGSKKPWRKEKIAFQNSPLSTYNWFLCARSRRSEDKWTPVYREDTRLQGGHPSTRRTPVYREDTLLQEDTRLQGRHRNGREGHPSTRRKPDQMFHRFYCGGAMIHTLAASNRSTHNPRLGCIATLRFEKTEFPYCKSDDLQIGGNPRFK